MAKRKTKMGVDVMKDPIIEFGRNKKGNAGIKIDKSKADAVRSKALKDLGKDLTIEGAKKGKDIVQSLPKLLKGDVISPVKALIEGGKHAMKIGKDIGKVLFNHPEWYTNYEEATKLVGLNFGQRNTVRNYSIGSREYDYRNTAAAMVMKLTIPKDSSGSFIQAMQLLYAKIRAANAGSVNYTVADLAAYVLNTRSIRAALAQLRRARQSVKNFNCYDSDMPRMLAFVAGCAEYSSSRYYGIDYDVLASNGANIDNFLTNEYLQVRNLLPLNLPLLDRTDWMYSNFFADSNDTKCSKMAFISYTFPLYSNVSNVVTLTSGIGMQPNNGTSFAANLQSILDSIDAAIKTTIGVPVNGIIAGDILKAFGQSAFYNASNYDAPDGAPIIYDEAALTQIQNAGFTQVDMSTQTCDFGTGTIVISGPTSSVAVTDVNEEVIPVNFYKDTVTAGELMSATRLRPFAEYSASATTIDICGTEVPIYSYALVYNTSFPAVGYSPFQLQSSTSDTVDATALKISLWSILDWSPRFKAYFNDNGTVSTAYLFDYNVWAELTQENQDQFTQIATLSLLYAPDEVERKTKFSFIKG